MAKAMFRGNDRSSNANRSRNSDGQTPGQTIQRLEQAGIGPDAKPVRMAKPRKQPAKPTPNENNARNMRKKVQKFERKTAIY